MRQHDRILHSHDFRRCKVGHIAAYLARRECRGHSRRINERVAREVQENHTLFHERTSSFIDHADRAIDRWHMDGDVIAFAIDIGKVGNMLNCWQHLPGSIDGNEQIVTHDLHAETERCVRNFSADRTKAENTERLAFDLAPSELLLRLFSGLTDHRILSVLLAPFDTAHDATACEQHAAQHELLHRISIRAWCIEHNDAFFGTTLERDVVYARTSTCDREQILRELHIEHACTAHENTLCSFNVVSEFIIACEKIGSLGRDIVQAVNVVQERSFPIASYMW